LAYDPSIHLDKTEHDTGFDISRLTNIYSEKEIVHVQIILGLTCIKMSIVLT